MSLREPNGRLKLARERGSLTLTHAFRVTFTTTRYIQARAGCLGACAYLTLCISWPNATLTSTPHLNPPVELLEDISEAVWGIAYYRYPGDVVHLAYIATNIIAINLACYTLQALDT